MLASGGAEALVLSSRSVVIVHMNFVSNAIFRSTCHVRRLHVYKQREAKLHTLGLKMKRRNTGQFLSGFKMENHRIQSAKTLLMKDSSSLYGREDMVSWLFQMQITDLNTDLMRFLKTSENKMVMFVIASSLDGIFRRSGKAVE